MNYDLRTLTVKHICNSHKPTHSPKLQKSLSVFQPFFADTKKQNQVGGKHGSDVARMKEKVNPAGNKVLYVMRVLAVFWAAARCCNTANSSLTIDGKFEIMNKRIGSVHN